VVGLLVRPEFYEINEGAKQELPRRATKNRYAAAIDEIPGCEFQRK
jgi:hypothetical protein